MRSDVVKKGIPAAPNRSLLYALGYTREELEAWRGDLREAYPFFDEIDREDFSKKNEVLITVKQLESIGFRRYTVMSR